MDNMWMIRCDGGDLYEDFREHGVIAIGWAELAAVTRVGMSRKELADLYRTAYPQTKSGTVISGASQVWRFINEIKVGDGVITYSPANRTYLFGTVTGGAEYREEWHDTGMALARPVAWKPEEIQRDVLSPATRNSLGSTLTIFLLPGPVVGELTAAASGAPVASTVSEELADEEILDPLARIDVQAIERIKDLLSRLSWQEMQELVAGILRAMGYKTQVSPGGADRGKDIIASPDGFGFENPRIVVEVKHRVREKMGSSDIRSFLGGRHKDDRGLYVSTGGFTQEALYEADRAPVPLTLWTLDHLVRALVDHYDSTDAETKRLIPLKRMYWPA